MNESKKSDVTILVNSCDFYEDAWYPFFWLLKKYWPQCKYDIVLNTETKRYECDYFNIKTINTGKDLSWTARLKYVLEQIDSEFILFFLEDYFLTSDVRIEAFEKALSIIKMNDDIGLVHFTPCEKYMDTPKNDLANCFYELPVRKRTLRTRVAISLFRKDYFKKLLYGDENPWQYERESHIRSYFAGYRIIRQDYSLYPPTFTYYLDHEIGIGITSRKWLKNNKNFFESNGLYDVNYQNLGILTDEVDEKIKTDRKKVSFRQWFYENVTHKLKRRTRHFWLLQDIINLKKYIKYSRYYKNYKK